MNARNWVFIIFMAGVFVCRATPYYVAETGDDDNDGSTWALAVKTISNGVAKATLAGDIVYVSNGTYTVTTPIVLNRNISVIGLDAPTGAVITTMYPDVNYSTRCVNVTSAGAVLEGVTVEKGYPVSGQAGGGIYLTAGLVSNCVVRNCITQAGNGGGIYMNGGSAMVSDSLVISNVNYNGNAGGVDISGGAKLRNTAVITNCCFKITGNAFGGGISMSGGSLTNCNISDNYAAGSAGGVNMLGACSIDGCMVSNNYTPVHGGGIYAYSAGSVFKVINTTSTHNLALACNAGITCLSGTMMVSNCVVKYNRASYGAGIANNASTASYGSMTVTHSQVVGNYAFGSEGGGLFFD